MGYIRSGASNDLLIVDKTNATMRATIKPQEITGSYRASLVSGTITFSNITSANGILFTFKNTGSSYCIVRTVRIGIQIIATGFTTTARPSFSLYRVPVDYDQGTSGGTGYGVGQSNSLVAKKRTSMNAHNASMVIYASGAGIVGDTATTEDTIPFGQVILGGTAAQVTTFPQAGLRGFFTAEKSADMAADIADMSSNPLVLAQNEGFRIKNDAAFIGGTTGAGTAALVITVEWDEASSSYID